VLYDSKQVIEQDYQEKKAVKPDNTVRNQESAISIFSKFCKEKYKTTPLKLCTKLAKESDIRVPCGILQAWIAWSVKQNHAASTIRTRFWYIKDFMYGKKIEITNLQIRKNIKLPKKQTKSLYPLKKEELRKLVDCASFKRKSLYLTHSSCGARIGELLQVRKKDIDTDSERWIINIRAETTKTQTERSTYMSKEAMKYTKQLLVSKEDNDLIWATNANPNRAEAAEQHALRGYLAKIGLDMRYEKTMIRKITSHSMRAYFFTKAVRTHGENYSHVLCGHGNAYLIEYDRLEPKEKLAMYLKLEPGLLVYENYNEDIADLREDNKKMKNRVRKLEKAVGIYNSVGAVSVYNMALGTKAGQEHIKQILKENTVDEIKHLIKDHEKEIDDLQE